MFLEAEKGVSLYRHIEQCIYLAKYYNTEIDTEFNGTKLRINPNSNEYDIALIWELKREVARLKGE